MLGNRKPGFYTRPRSGGMMPVFAAVALGVWGGFYIFDPSRFDSGGANGTRAGEGGQAAPADRTPPAAATPAT